MKKCPTCKKEKVNREFGWNTKSCKECNKKECIVCKNIYCPTGKKQFCSNKCKILGNININLNGCWEWKNPDIKGYGWTKNYETKRNMLAHRMSYEIFKGEIPKGLSVCHKCDNPSCVNPEHLWIGTHKCNMWDSWKKGRAYLPRYNSQGLNNGNTKISENDVREIRKLSSEGMFYSEIAEIYKLTKQYIGAIVRRVTWKHID